MPPTHDEELVPPGEYARRVDAERKAFENNTEIHNLPSICFYWLNRYILPQLSSLGHKDADSFFLNNFSGRITAQTGGVRCQRYAIFSASEPGTATLRSGSQPSCANQARAIL